MRVCGGTFTCESTPLPGAPMKKAGLLARFFGFRDKN
jgi:hypothetical protein